MNNLLLTLCGLVMVSQIAIAQNQNAVFASANHENFLTETNYSESDDNNSTVELESLIKDYPKRLDYRFEKMHNIYKQKDWTSFTNEVLDLIDYSYATKHNWEWNRSENAVGENPEAFLLNTVKDYVFMLYYTEDVKLHDDIRKISNKVLKQRPNEFDFVTYFPMTYQITGDYDKALTYLLRAEKLSNQNGVITSSIAKCNYELGNHATAMVYYKKTVEWGDAQEKADAIAKIAVLENNNNNTTTVK